LAVINDTGEDVKLKIGDWDWDVSAYQEQTIQFPAGEYDYKVILASGDEIQDHGKWQPGRNKSLRLPAQ
jgi:hypothetical protein